MSETIFWCAPSTSKNLLIPSEELERNSISNACCLDLTISNNGVFYIWIYKDGSWSENSILYCPTIINS